MDKVSAAFILFALTFGHALLGMLRRQHPYHWNSIKCCLLPVIIPDLLLGVSSGKKEEQGNGKPPLSALRIGGETLAGLVSGVVGGIGTYIAMYDLGMEPGFTFDEIPKLLLSFGGTLSATALCSSIAIYLVGNIGNETGAFPTTLIGGILGALIGGGVPLGGCLLLIGNPSPRPNAEEPIEVGRAMVAMGSMVVGMIGATIGAIIGFNLTRKYKSSVTRSIK